MTSAQITYVLGELGYPDDAWTALSDVSMINLSMLPRIYTDSSKMRFKFNTTTENLEIVYGTATESGFTSEAGETTNYTPQTFVRFDIIMAFHKSLSTNSIYGTYYKKSFGSAVDYTTN